MSIRAVIFDLDDTLYLERDYAYSGFRAVARAFAGVLGDPEASTRAMQALFETRHRRRVFNHLLEKFAYRADERLVQRMVATFRAHRPAIRLLPDAEAAIARLSSRFRLGLLTDGPPVMQHAKINALGLTGRIDYILVTEDYGPECAKPSPRPFEMVAESLRVDHSACLYVGDNAAKDFVAPNRLGWLSVQIVRPGGIYRDQRPVAGGVPTHRITSLDELDDHLSGGSCED